MKRIRVKVWFGDDEARFQIFCFMDPHVKSQPYTVITCGIPQQLWDREEFLVFPYIITDLKDTFCFELRYNKVYPCIKSFKWNY